MSFMFCILVSLRSRPAAAAGRQIKYRVAMSGERLLQGLVVTHLQIVRHSPFRRIHSANGRLWEESHSPVFQKISRLAGLPACDRTSDWRPSPVLSVLCDRPYESA